MSILVTVEDQTSALLCCAEAHALPPWSPNQIIKDTLRHYAERGDIQVSLQDVYGPKCFFFNWSCPFVVLVKLLNEITFGSTNRLIFTSK